MAETPTAYLSYVEVVRASATKLCAVYAREESRSRNFVRLGAPQPADEGVYTYVEIAGEEQRRMTEFMPARLIGEAMNHMPI